MDLQIIRLILWILLPVALFFLAREIIIQLKWKPYPTRVRNWSNWSRLGVILIGGLIPGIIILLVMDAYQDRLERWFYRLP